MVVGRRGGCAQKANQGSLGFGPSLLPLARLYPEPQNQTGWVRETTAASLEGSVPSELTGGACRKAANPQRCLEDLGSVRVQH